MTPSMKLLLILLSTTVSATPIRVMKRSFTDTILADADRVPKFAPGQSESSLIGECCTKKIS